MISSDLFLENLRLLGVSFFAGVPDSLMKELNYAINDSTLDSRHIIASNEGSAVGLAIGHYAATQEMPAVYMQNSGLGNAYNPLVSLADPAVYSIPMLLLIGWRGEIGDDGYQIKDEPQHVKQGQVTLSTLNALDIPFVVINSHTVNWKNDLEVLINTSNAAKRPVAVVFRKNTFEATSSFLKRPSVEPDMAREEAIEHIVKHSNPNDIFVASTGMISRELFEIRRKYNLSHDKDFLTVGGMGHASQIAAGIALNLPKKRVICLDGDGAMLMHSGGMAECALQDNLVHFILNNGAHDSVGGQPTKAFHLNLQKIASGFGYVNTAKASSKIEIVDCMSVGTIGSVFIEVPCKRGNRKDLGRPDRNPEENLKSFMKFLQGMKDDC